MDKTKIKQLRQALGITQKELADMIGVSINTIQNYERGTIIPPAKQKLLSDMLKNAQNSISQSGTFNGPIQNSISGSNVIRDKDVPELEKEIAFLRKRIEDQERIINEKERLISILMKDK